MRRRTFLATLPLAAAGASGFSQPVAAFAQSKAPQDLPPFQAAGEDRFIRPDVHAGDRPAGASFSSRSPALGCSGAAGTAHPIATQVAIEMLKRGGSAVDAAVAANACLGFLEPTSSGLGGDCYAFVWDPKQAKVMGMASSGRSPKGLSLATARSRAINGVLPKLGAVTVSTPGALDGWWTLHQRYGRLKWAELFAPLLRVRCAGAADYWLVHQAQHGDLYQTRLWRGRNSQRRAHVRAGRKDDQRIRCLPQS